MKKVYTLKTILITIVIFIIGFNQSNAQVGIGNTSPQGALDITTLANPNADGLLIPRVALALTTTATVLTPTVSEMVYNTATAGDVTPGFYFWDGTKWVRIVTGATTINWTTTGNAGTTVATNYIGTSDAIALRIGTNGTERMRVLSGGQVAINNTAPAGGNLLTVTNNATNLYAINAYNTITGGQAIYGTTTNIASALSTIEGATNSPEAAGVYGITSATPTAGFPTPTGLIGGYTGATSTGIRIGVKGISGQATASPTTGNQLIGVQGSYNGAGSFFGIGVYGLAAGGAYIGGNVDAGVVGWRTNTQNFSGYFNGNHVIASGTKSASVGTSKGNQLLYVTETPGVWFEDVGRGKLQDGYVKITLDPMFLETVFIDDKHPISVFLQEEGDSKGLYVIPQKEGFIVKEKQSGTSNIEFSYRIMAKRLHFQDHRFGSDPVWGPGDTRKYNRYATPPPMDYSEKLKMDEYNKKNTQKDLYPEGFIIPADKINQQAISRESIKDVIKK